MGEVTPVLVCLTPGGFALATGLADTLGAEVHGRAGRCGARISFDDTLGHLRDLFAAGHPVIGLCAAGILIRAVAPLLNDKRGEPALLALAEDGSAVIPLLGGHRGANALAVRIAAELGIRPSLSTAGELALGVALDDPPPGWCLANPEDAGPAMAAILGGAAVRVRGRLPWEGLAREGAAPGVELHGSEAEATDCPARLTYHPRRHVLGVGCARNCPPEQLHELAHQVLAAAGIASAALAGIASLDLKCDEPALLALAEGLGLPLRFFSAPELEAETPRLANPSEIVLAEVGCHGVAEAAALAAAGPQARLTVEKRKSAMATAAIASSPGPMVSMPGRKRGSVALIGLGPGRSDWRTPEASGLIARADLLVGYGLYLDLIGPVAAGKPRAEFALGEEQARCRYALEAAAAGRDVALICSGDAGIYAMGALVYELLDRPAERGGVSPAARRVEVITTPGISALQAASARSGAPLGHDFCAISLSDLLTPRADILRRVKAAAKGDFVTVFYNPVSRRRRELFAEACRMLLAHRPADTPVILAHSLGRPDERIVLRRLCELQVEDADMLTTVIVGSTATRLIGTGDGPRVYTPRGYARKLEAAS